MQLSSKVSQSVGFLIFPCESPSSDVCHIFILKVILLYFTPQHTHECYKLRISSAKKKKNQWVVGARIWNRQVGFMVIS